MPTDATGTPTALGIPKFNTNVDAPSGLGFNAAMDEIDSLIGGRMESPTSPASGDVPVWNGTAWVKSSTTKMSEGGIDPGAEGDVLTVVGGVSAWAAPSPGAMTLLDDHTVSGSVLADYDTNTQLGGNIPDTYKHLRLVVSGRSSAAVQAEALLAQVNGDTGGNYDYNYYSYAGAAAGGNASAAAQTSAHLGRIAGATATAGLSGEVEIFFPNFAGTTFQKQARSGYSAMWGTGAGNSEAGQGRMNWRSTAAITRIRLLPATGSFAIGTRFSLYGIS